MNSVQRSCPANRVGSLDLFFSVLVILQAVMSLRFALKFVEIRPAEASEACMRQKIPGGWVA